MIVTLTIASSYQDLAPHAETEAKCIEGYIDDTPSAEAPSSTSPTRPRKAVSITCIRFCASKLNRMGRLIFTICLLEYT